MAYASQFTGGDADSRRAEADRILAIIGTCDVTDLTPKERNFLEEMAEGDVSGKQLLWLRDIKDKLL